MQDHKEYTDTTNQLTGTTSQRTGTTSPKITNTTSIITVTITVSITLIVVTAKSIIQSVKETSPIKKKRKRVVAKKTQNGHALKAIRRLVAIHKLQENATAIVHAVQVQNLARNAVSQETVDALVDAVLKVVKFKLKARHQKRNHAAQSLEKAQRGKVVQSVKSAAPLMELK